MFDRAALKYEIYQRLMKSPVTPGFFTAPKVNSAIQEAIDYVSAEMFEADNGFLKKIEYIDVEANALTIPVPPHMAMIEEVRYQVGNVYVPLSYDSQWQVPQWSVNSGATQLPATYRIVDNKFYFAPALGVGGVNYLQVEYQGYPSVLRTDAQKIDSQFDRSMLYFIIYRSCSILASAIGQNVKAWEKEEALWHQKMINIVYKRNNGTTTIKDFAGYS